MLVLLGLLSLPSARQHPSYGDCLEVKREFIRTALCWIVWHNVLSQKHTSMSSSYRSNRLGLSHWDPYAVHRGSCLALYYCNMVEWFWCDSSLISTTNWFPSVLWHCLFGHLAIEIIPNMTYGVLSGTLRLSLYTAAAAAAAAAACCSCLIFDSLT